MSDEYQGKHEADPVVGEAPPKAPTLFSNKVYDRLKFIALVVLPALAIFYGGLGDLWDFPETDKVVGTLILVDTLLGALLQLSSKQYSRSDAGYDGHMFVGPGETPDARTVGLQVVTPASELEGKDSVRFKIHQQE